jgi:hypothetical protein
VQVKVGKQISAAALQNTDGSASHPYQFFSKNRYCAAITIGFESICCNVRDYFLKSSLWLSVRSRNKCSVSFR